MLSRSLTSMRTTSSGVGCLLKASTPGNAGSMTCLSAQSVVNRLPPASTNARMRVIAAAETWPGQLTMSNCSGRSVSRSSSCGCTSPCGTSSAPSTDSTWS